MPHRHPIRPMRPIMFILLSALIIATSIMLIHILGITL